VSSVLGGARMPQPGLHDLDGLPVPDEERGVVVAQVVQAGAGRHPGASHRRPPDRVAEATAPQRLPRLIGEHQAEVAGRERLQVRGEGGNDDVRERHRASARLRLGRR
jgi:hypothetical protein